MLVEKRLRWRRRRAADGRVPASREGLAAARQTECMTGRNSMMLCCCERWKRLAIGMGWSEWGVLVGMPHSIGHG